MLCIDDNLYISTRIFRPHCKLHDFYILCYRTYYTDRNERQRRLPGLLCIINETDQMRTGISAFSPTFWNVRLSLLMMMMMIMIPMASSEEPEIGTRMEKNRAHGEHSDAI